MLNSLGYGSLASPSPWCETLQIGFADWRPCCTSHATLFVVQVCAEHDCAGLKKCSAKLTVCFDSLNREWHAVCL